MQIRSKSFLSIVPLLFFSSAALAQENADERSTPSVTQSAPKDGPDVEVISANGSITRSQCPYTCEKRGIPKQNCREWKSKMYGDKCYVQDLRLPSDAIPLGGQSSGKGK